MPNTLFLFARYSLTPPPPRLSGRANIRPTALEVHTHAIHLIKDSIAIATLIVTEAGDDIVHGTRPTNLGHIGAIGPRRPDGRPISLGGISREAAVAHDQGGPGTVHDGPADAASLFDVVRGIEVGSGNVVDELGVGNDHGAAILQGGAAVAVEGAVDDLGEGGPLGVDDGALLTVGTCVAVFYLGEKER